MNGRTSRKAGTFFDLLQKYAIILSEIKFRRVLNLTYYKRFFEELQQDFKAFAYWCGIFTLFRIAFIAIYSG